MVKFWDTYSSWEEAEAAWDASLPASTRSAAPPPMKVRGLRRKSLAWMIKKDHDSTLRKQFFRHPFRYTLRYISSLCRRTPYHRDGDLFFYGFPLIDAFLEQLAHPSSHLVLGFSYCQKPMECPDERFSSTCRHDPNHPICRRCPIGKAINAMPRGRVTCCVIPRVHDIARTLFDVQDDHPKHHILFAISSCQLSLSAFGDFAAMAGFRGIGWCLGGQVCPNFRAFQYAEEGIKRGRTGFQNPDRYFGFLRAIRASILQIAGAREEQR